MGNEFFKNLKVGDEVIINDVFYEIGKVTSLTPKQVTVNGSIKFRLDKYGDLRYLKPQYSSRRYNIHPVTEHLLKRVAESTAIKAQRQAEEENKKLQAQSDAAEMEAFFLTEEGEKYLALQNEWKGTAITFVNYDNGRSWSFRHGVVKILDPKTNERFAEVEIIQHYDDDYKNNCKTVKAPEISVPGYGNLNFQKRKKIVEAEKIAIAIAEEWNKFTGKVIPYGKDWGE